MNENSGSTEHQLGLSKKEPATPTPRWYSRGYLPHFDDVSKLQSITFRLADSLPQCKLKQLNEELAGLPEDKQSVERRKRIEEWLDAGMGCCALRHPEVAGTVQDSLLRFDGERYRLISWCIMPNHVHVLIRPAIELGKILQSWKSFTGRRALAKNAELELGVPGKAFWMREYWDRFIRDERYFNAVVEYIHNNPANASLCRIPSEWKWSSAGSGNAKPQLGM